MSSACNSIAELQRWRRMSSAERTAEMRRLWDVLPYAEQQLLTIVLKFLVQSTGRAA